MFITRLDYLVQANAEANGEAADLGRSTRRDSGTRQGVRGTRPAYAGFAGLSGELQQARTASDPTPTSPPSR